MNKLSNILFIVCFLLGYKASMGQAIVLEKPTKTSIWPAYSIQKITWNATNIENIKIEASLDSGRNWIIIQNSYPASAGYYEWEIPNKVSDSCYIRVSDVQNANTNSTNYKNNPFKIPSPTLSLESFENFYYAKQQLPVIWNSSGIKKVNIYLSYDNKASFQKIASNIAANTFSFNHILKDTTAGNCFVAIVDTSNTNVGDTSKILFSVAIAPIGRASKFKGGIFDGHATKNNLPKNLSLNTSNKFDSLIGGQKLTINWSGNNLDYIDLLYSIDSLRTWKIIDSNISAQSLNYDWKVPNIPTGFGKIKIWDASDSNFNDVSDTCFVIRKKTLTLKPILEQVYTKAVLPIYWSGLGIDKLKIYIGNTLIADSINALNETFNWIVPFNLQNAAYIKIMDISDSTILDSVLLGNPINLPNGSSFKNKGGYYDGHSYKSNIKGKVNIVYPNGGERIPKSARINFKWTSSEIDYLKLFYSLDGGVNWQLVDSNIVGNLGFFSWKLPNTTSNSVLTKLVYTSDSSVSDFSNGTFTIVDKELTLQLDKSSWMKNNVNQISWSSFGVDSLSIYYKQMDSANWKIIPNNISTNAELYNWYTHSLTSNKVIVKIVDYSDSLLFAQDTVTFISNSITTSSNYKYKGGKFDGHSFKSNINKIIINKPVANEVLVSGKPYAVNWDYLNLSDTVLLQYSIDSGKTWINIEKVSALLGTYEWVIPVSSNTVNSVGVNNELRNVSNATTTINSDKCLIRVLDIKAGNEVVGMSKGIFTIKPNEVLIKPLVSFNAIPNTTWTGSVMYRKMLGSTNSNDTLKYYIVSGNNASIVNDTLVITGPGALTIGCFDPGSANYSKSDTITQAFCVNPIAPTISRDANNNLISSSMNGNKWYKEALLLSDTSKIIKPTSNGNYTVSTTQNGCTSSFSSTYYFVVTDIIVINNNEYIKIDPNPFYGQATLRFQLNGYNKLNLEIYEVSTGRKIQNISSLFDESKIRLDKLSNGFYLFKFITPDYKYTYQFKMLKL